MSFQATRMLTPGDYCRISSQMPPLNTFIVPDAPKKFTIEHLLTQKELKVELFEKEAPETVKNFLSYVEMYGTPKVSALVLNSVANIKRAYPYFEAVERVYLLLDNDV